MVAARVAVVTVVGPTEVVVRVEVVTELAAAVAVAKGAAVAATVMEVMAAGV